MAKNHSKSTDMTSKKVVANLRSGAFLKASEPNWTIDSFSNMKNFNLNNAILSFDSHISIFIIVKSNLLLHEFV